MPVQADFSLSRRENALLTLGMAPPTPIGGWEIYFTVTRRFGGMPLITKCVASGYSTASGIEVISSGNGVYQVTINSLDTSGFQYGNYAYSAERVNSGFRTDLTQGYFSINPGGG